MKWRSNREPSRDHQDGRSPGCDRRRRSDAQRLRAAVDAGPGPDLSFRRSADGGESAAAAPIAVTLRRIEFPQATEGDRILGVTGVETAYIAGARWISDARDLYTESLEGAFAAQSSRVRLTGFREVAPATYSLVLDVRAFEARYPAPGAAPTVVVSVRARLLSSPRRDVAAERAFTVEQPATANRVGPIVEAFDIAVRDLNTRVVAWADASVGQSPGSR